MKLDSPFGSSCYFCIFKNCDRKVKQLAVNTKLTFMFVCEIGQTCQLNVLNDFPVPRQSFFKPVARPVVRVEAEHILVMCCYWTNGLWLSALRSSKYLRNTGKMHHLPSPNPKQGIRLSSSKAESVLPMIVIACSYGFNPSPKWCKLLPPNECCPVHSLLLVKSIPTIRFDDSRPDSRRASVT